MRYIRNEAWFKITKWAIWSGSIPIIALSTTSGLHVYTSIRSGVSILDELNAVLITAATMWFGLGLLFNKGRKIERGIIGHGRVKKDKSGVPYKYAFMSLATMGFIIWYIIYISAR